MNSELFQDILNRTREIPQEMASEVENNWRQIFRILVENNGQNFFDQIVEYLKQCGEIKNIQQARWSRFLARTLLLVHELPADIRELAVSVYFSAGIYLAAVSMRTEEDIEEDIEEDSFFSCLCKAKQLVEKNEVEKSKLELEDAKNKFPNMKGAIELGEKIGMFICSEKTKIIFFVKPQMDSFLGDIIECLKNDYEIKKCIVTEVKQIDEGMEWADVCWFEWCDELVIYGSQLKAAKRKRLICRLHSYEAFIEYPKQVTWNVVDQVIFVAEHIREFVLENVPALKKEQTIIIPNGIDLTKHDYKERKHGFNIAYVGYINYKKGPMLLLHTFKAIYDEDKRYKLFIAGQFQDPRDVLYFRQMIKEWELKDNVIFEGWQNNINQWLEDKNYLISTSILEGHPVGIMEAMAKGIKPLIHNFVGARQIYPKEYIWNTSDECIEIIKSDYYSSPEYRKFIEGNFSKRILRNNILDLFLRVIENKNESYDFGGENSCLLNQVSDLIKSPNKDIYFENLTVMIRTYNRAKILISDIEKDLKFGCVKKLIVDDHSKRRDWELIRHSKNRSDIWKIIRNSSNQGAALTMNKGFQNIKSEYVISLDDDDMLLCRDFEHMKEDLSAFNEQNDIMMIPRYIINLHEDGMLSIGYDRMLFDKMQCKDALRKLALSGEMMALNAGAVYKTEVIKRYNNEPMFKVGEDFVRIVRLFAENSHKKILVSNSFVYVRRISNTSLSKTISSEKVAISLYAMLIACFYGIRLDILSKEEVFEAIQQRGLLLQKIYGMGEQFAKGIIDYLSGKIDKKMVHIKLGLDACYQIPKEIDLIKKNFEYKG